MRLTSWKTPFGGWTGGTRSSEAFNHLSSILPSPGSTCFRCPSKNCSNQSCRSLAKVGSKSVTTGATPNPTARRSLSRSVRASLRSYSIRLVKDRPSRPTAGSLQRRRVRGHHGTLRHGEPSRDRVDAGTHPRELARAVTRLSLAMKTSSTSTGDDSCTAGSLPGRGRGPSSGTTPGSGDGAWWWGRKGSADEWQGERSAALARRRVAAALTGTIPGTKRKRR